MNTLRDAAQQALEALKLARLNGKNGLYPGELDEVAATIAALDAALAEPQPEPVAIGTVGELFTNAAWQRLDLRPSTKVYITPPQRQPLTDEEIVDLCAAWDATPGTSMADLVRMTEKAHGIGGDK